MTIPSRPWFILWHKPSRGYMPELRKPLRGGYTHTEPAQYPYPPRIFSTEAAAKVALTWWLKGVTCEDSEPDFYGEIDGGLYTVKPKRPRVREEWEVVPVDIVMKVPPMKVFDLIGQHYWE